MQNEGSRELGGIHARARFLLGTVLFLFLALGFRYFHLMVVRHEQFRELALEQSRRTESLPGFRGTILDRRGRDLALSQTVPSIAVDPARVAPDRRETFAREVGAALDVDPKSILDSFGRPGCSFRWIRRFVRDPGAVRRVEELGWHDAIIVRDEITRSYPNGSVAAPLIGVTDTDGKGLTGVEVAWNQALAPKAGHRVVLRDGWHSRRISSPPPGSVVPSENGEDVKLALELTIQTYVEEALSRACREWSPKSAAAVVMDPANGDVLAIASRPDFDPEHRKGVPIANFRVRAATDAFPPGSVIKPLVSAYALDEGIISFSDTFDCTSSGVWFFKRRGIHDHGAGLGVVPFPQVIIHSSNIGAAQIGLRVGIERMWRLFHTLGFGSSTGSGVPIESSGHLTRLEHWTDRNTLCSVSFGQEMAVTPLQFTTAFACLVNGGILYRPRLVLSVGGVPVPVEARRQVYSPEVVRRLMVPLLVRVVEEGTGKPARIPGFSVGGKTGTAQKIKSTGEVYGYVSSFIGFAPAKDPRFLVYVVMNEPTRSKGAPYGGRCAAPAVREILSRCLKYAEIPPDRAADLAGGR